MRTLVIGDIHGGLKALQQLAERARFDTADQLIFLGDYVDGWSESAQTIKYLIELSQQMNCIFIRGNHDQLCLDWLAEDQAPEMWKMHGGLATMASYEDLDKEEIATHISFYKNLKDYHLDTQNRLFLHAGFTNVKGVAHEYFSKMFYWDRTLWELALAVKDNLDQTHEYYPKRLQLYREIYIGHTPVTRIGKTWPVQAKNVINVDTGAAFKGPVTAMDIDTKEVWQSDNVYQFYPDEKGRN